MLLIRLESIIMSMPPTFKHVFNAICIGFSKASWIHLAKFVDLRWGRLFEDCKVTLLGMGHSSLGQLQFLHREIEIRRTPL